MSATLETSALADSGSLTYPHLFAPLRVANTELRNRIVMGAMHTRLENEPDAAHRLAAYFSERAKGGVGLIITGGYAPDVAGLIEPGGPILNAGSDLDREHRPVTDAVHSGGAKILLQILHTGRYGKHPDLIAPSPIKSRINSLQPREMTAEDIAETIENFVTCAALAQKAGYDGVEIMGSEGYLLNQFLAPRVNKRGDEWGGSLANRMRLAVEIVQQTRARVGENFILMYRISALDLVEGGLTAAEIDVVARAIEAAGADILNTGYGWHEAAVPTIAQMVPRGVFRKAAARLARVVSIPVVASNRINTPELAEDIVAQGDAALISMARPLLADPEFANKAAAGRRDDINICIACNQACLNYAFSEKISTCLVNPKACRETEFDETPPKTLRRVAVVGAGPAGLAFAVNAARRGHKVTLFEAAADIGGQLNLAVRVPGKLEFAELIRYFRTQLKTHGVHVHTGVRASAAMLIEGGFDRVVIASGVRPRFPEIPGVEGPSVVGYADVILGKAKVGASVAIIGTGGIGHDVAETVTSEIDGDESVEDFCDNWGIDLDIQEAGGLRAAIAPRRGREVTMLQRGNARIGARLGKSTGWIHRAELSRRNVKAVAGCHYTRIDDEGLHYEANGASHVARAETVIICAGQESLDELSAALQAAELPCDVIGGARFAGELDALRAIDEGTRLAYSL